VKRSSLCAVALFAFPTLVFAQQAGRAGSPPAEILGPQLVDWSELQTPRPVPQPLPSSERADPQQPEPGTESQPLSGTFTGTILKDKGKYFLRVSANAIYLIDDGDTAKPFETSQVKIAGSLDAATNILHVARIEAVS
jgi:hypothetical protein